MPIIRTSDDDPYTALASRTLRPDGRAIDPGSTLYGTDPWGQLTANGGVIIPGGDDNPYQEDNLGQVTYRGRVVLPNQAYGGTPVDTSFQEFMQNSTSGVVPMAYGQAPISSTTLAAQLGADAGTSRIQDSTSAMADRYLAGEKTGVTALPDSASSGDASGGTQSPLQAGFDAQVSALGSLGDLIDAAAANASAGINAAVDDGRGRLQETAGILAERGQGAVDAQVGLNDELLASLGGVGGEIGNIATSSDGGSGLLGVQNLQQGATDGVSSLIPAAGVLGSFMAQNQIGRNQAYQNYVGSLEAQLGVLGAESLTQVQRTQQKQQGVLDYQIAQTQATQAIEQARYDQDIAATTASSVAASNLLRSAGLDPNMFPGVDILDATRIIGELTGAAAEEDPQDGVFGTLPGYGFTPQGQPVVEKLLGDIRSGTITFGEDPSAPGQQITFDNASSEAVISFLQKSVVVVDPNDPTSRQILASPENGLNYYAMSPEDHRALMSWALEQVGN